MCWLSRAAPREAKLSRLPQIPHAYFLIDVNLLTSGMMRKILYGKQNALYPTILMCKSSSIHCQDIHSKGKSASLKHALWTTNEWLTNLICIFTLQTTLLPTSTKKVYSTKKMHLLDKVLLALGKTLLITLLFSMLSQITSAKLSMENSQTMNSESIMRKADLISIQIIR